MRLTQSIKAYTHILCSILALLKSATSSLGRPTELVCLPIRSARETSLYGVITETKFIDAVETLILITPSLGHSWKSRIACVTVSPSDPELIGKSTPVIRGWNEIETATFYQVPLTVTVDGFVVDITKESRIHTGLR